MERWCHLKTYGICNAYQWNVDKEDLEIIKYVSKELDNFKMNSATIVKKIDYIKAKAILDDVSLLSVHPLPFMYSCNVKYELGINV